MAEIRIRIRLQGKTPLLMNRYSPEKQRRTKEGRGGRRDPIVTDKTDREMAEGSFFLAKDYDPNFENPNQPGIPSANLLASFRDGGFNVNVPGRKRNVSSKTLGSFVWSGMEIEEDFIPLTIGKEDRLATKEDATIDFAMVTPQGSSGSKIPVYTPRFTGWSVEFVLMLDDEELSEALAKEVIRTAGKKAGVLSRRPAKNANFGKYNIADWEVLPPGEIQ